MKHFPLTHIQKGILFHVISEDKPSYQYIVQTKIYIEGDIQLNLFKKAWQAIIKKHPALRAKLTHDLENLETLLISDQATINFNLIDLSRTPDQAMQIKRLLEKDYQTSIDLRRAPLMRHTIIKLNKKKRLLIWTYHHIILDGYSSVKILREVFQSYELILKNKAVAKKNADNELVQLEDNLDKAYWNKVFDNFSSVTKLALPMVETENDVFTFEEKSLDKNVYQHTNRWCKKNNVTMSVLVYTAWGILMRHYSQQQDVIFGVVRSLSRNKYKNKFGLLLNTLPIAIKVTKTTTSNSLIQSVTEQLNGIKRNTETPLSKLQSFLKYRIEDELFDTAVNVMSPTVSYLSKQWQFENISINIETMNVRTHYAIMFDVLIDPLNLSFRLNYQPNKLNRALAQQILNQFSHLLEQITLKNKYVVDFSILLPYEKKLILSLWNNTKKSVSQNKTLIDLFLSQCKKFKDNIAIQDNKKCLTYSEVDELSNSLANYLINNGIKANAVVGIYMQRELSTIISILAILRAGARYLPLDPNYPKDRLTYMLSDSNCTNVITNQTLYAACNGLLEGKKGTSIFIYQQAMQEAKPAFIEVNFSSASSGMSVIYTSGSTGKPKGVCNTHIGALNRIIWMKNNFNIQETDKILHKTSFCFDVSVWEIFLPLISGAELILAPKEANKASDLLIQAIKKYKVTALHFVPSLLKVFLFDEHVESCKSVKQVFSSGEALSVTTVNDFFSKLPSSKLYNLYGPTEASIDVTWWQCQSNTQLKRIPIGKPIDNTQCYVLGYDGKLVSPGVVGELYLAGIGLASGYINHPELTNERFIHLRLCNNTRNRVYKTGDWAYWRENGILDYIGRKDQQVKLRGYRIELGEIESCIVNYPNIQNAVVLIKKTPATQDYLAAYVQFKPNQDINFNNIKTFVAKTLPSFMVPEQWIIIDKFLTLPNGKINVNALPEPEWEKNHRIQSTNQKKSSNSSIERILKRLWTEVLKIESIQLNNNFFEIGGDSILSIQLSILARQYNLDIRPRDIFEHPTIDELSNFIDTHIACRRELINPGKRIPVSTIQNDLLKFQNMHYIHYWHQIFPWKCKTSLNLELIKKAWNVVLNHHSIFFYTFHIHDQQWYMEKQNKVTSNIVEYAVSTSTSLKHIKALEEKLNIFKYGLNISKGPLANIILITHKKNVIYCYPIFHHLIIDIISWLVLLKEVEITYKNLLEGNELILPKPTMPYHLWAEAVNPINQITAGNRNTFNKIFQDINLNENNTEENSCILQYQILESTYKKIKSIIVQSNIGIDTLILFILNKAIKTISKNISINVDVERNGRDIFKNSYNYTSSIGWFTVIDTVQLFEIDPKRMIFDQLIDFKTKLNNCIKNKKTNESYSFGNSVICINNLGDFDLWNRNNHYFEMKYDAHIRTRHPKCKRFYCIEIETYVLNGKLHIDWRIPKLLAENDNFKRVYKNFFTFFHLVLKESTLFFYSSLYSLTRDEKDNLKAIHEKWKKTSKIKIGPIKNIYPLNNTQKGILFHCLQQSTQYSYINQMTLTINGKFDRKKLEQSLEYLFQSYEILRSGIIFRELSQASIAIFRNCGIPFLWKDLSKLSTKTIEEKIHHYCQSAKQKEISLNSPILLRFACFKKADTNYAFIITYHHIILDGWSLSILIKALILGCEWKQASQNNFLYKDYMNYYRQLNMTIARNYWQSLLGKNHLDHKLIQLPTLGISNDNGYPYDQYIYTLPKAIVKNLFAIASQLKVTLSTLFQCAWAMTLHFYMQKDNIVYGTTTSGRRIELPDIEKAVGVFIQTFPVALTIYPTTTVAELIGLLQKQIVESISFSYYPLSEIIGEKTSENGWLKTLLVYENYPDPMKGNHALSIRASNSFDPTHYPITIIIHPRETFQLSIQYQTSMYTKQQMETMAQSFVEALKHTYLSTQSKIDTLCLLPAKAYQQLAYNWNNTKCSYNTKLTLIELFVTQAKKTPKEIALIDENASLTYEQLEKSTNQFAHYLNSIGIKKDMRIIIKMSRHIGYIKSIIAILKCSAAYIPLTNETPDERVREIIKNSQAEWLITDQNNFLVKHSTPIHVLYFNQLLEQSTQAVKSPLPIKTDSQTTCYVTYTSGSTGRPKGVEITHRSVVNILFDMRKRFKKDFRFLLITDFTFDISNLEIFLPLLFGGVGLLIDIKNILIRREKLNPIIKKYNINYLQSTPSILQKLLQNHMPIEITVLSGGEKLSSELAIQLLSSNICLWNFYGPTETTIWSTAYQVSARSLKRRNIPIGKPISNTSVYVLDHKQRLVPEGVIGELYIGGDGLAKGYLNDNKQTQGNFVRVNCIPEQPKIRLYKTGDFVYWDKDGELIFTGREDEQIKINGIRIEIHEIESILNQHPFVEEAVVLLTTLENNEKRLIAILVLHYKNVLQFLFNSKFEVKALSGWQKIYDEVYQQNHSHLTSASSKQAQYDTAGWVSSYTKKPVPYPQMEDWINQAIEQISRFCPKRILEVGCGTGNMLYRLSTGCERYVGLDISKAVINKIKQSLINLQVANKVELYPCSILQFEYQSKYFDAIILNSVIQYYPTREYLYNSLNRCIDFTLDGGRIFVGDVRGLELSTLFHFSTVFTDVNKNLTISELLTRMDRRKNTEKELLVSPFFFYEFVKKNDRITHLDIHLENSSYSNEMTEYRYNVVLHISHFKNNNPLELDWSTFESFEKVDQALSNAPRYLAVEKLTNSLLLQLSSYLTQLKNTPESNILSSLNEFEQIKEKTQSEKNQCLVLAKKYNYAVRLIPSRISSSLFDVLFYKKGDDEVYFASIDSRKSILTKIDQNKNKLVNTTNYPLINIHTSFIFEKIKSDISKKLVSVMVPTVFHAVNKMPLTPSGKINKKGFDRFTTSINRTQLINQYIEPVSITEKKLAAIWESILKQNRVGRFDNFFDLGGHSLLALELLGKIYSTFNVSIALSNIVRCKNLLELSQDIDNKTGIDKDKTQLKQSNIILLNKKIDTQPELFLIHPVGGTIFCYIPLATALSNKISIYGIEDPDINQGNFKYKSISQLASKYIHQIDLTHRNKPYFLGGLSLGGTIAVEMAAQLEKDNNRHCKGLFLLDTWSYMGDVILSKPYLQSAMKRQYKRLRLLLKNKKIPNPEVIFALNLSRMEMNKQYKPDYTLHKHPVFLFKAKRLSKEYKAIDNENNYWKPYIKNLRIYQVSGNHETVILPPNVSKLSKLILEIITKLQEGAD